MSALRNYRGVESVIRCPFRHFSSLAVPSFGRVRRLARLSATDMHVGLWSRLCQRSSDPEAADDSAWRRPPAQLLSLLRGEAPPLPEAAPLTDLIKNRTAASDQAKQARASPAPTAPSSAFACQRNTDHQSPPTTSTSPLTTTTTPQGHSQTTYQSTTRSINQSITQSTGCPPTTPETRLNPTGHKK